MLSIDVFHTEICFKNVFALQIPLKKEGMEDERRPKDRVKTG
jgi:hypothetical protein